VFEKRVGLPSSYIFYTCVVRDFICIGVWLRLLFKVFFVLKCIKIIFFIFKKLFLRSAHQNNLKHTKKLIFNKKKFWISLHLFLIGQPDMEAPKILGLHLQKLVIKMVRVYNNLWVCWINKFCYEFHMKNDDNEFTND